MSIVYRKSHDNGQGTRLPCVREWLAAHERVKPFAAMRQETMHGCLHCLCGDWIQSLPQMDPTCSA